MVYPGRCVAVCGDPCYPGVSLAEIAGAAEPAGLSARRRFEVARMTYPYGVHAAVVAVDPGTGQVRVLRYLVACEVGRAVNPMLVEGQLRGGVAQGVGGALLRSSATTMRASLRRSRSSTTGCRPRPKSPRSTSW
jgi:CO/xanthine dehydrogenase Mo-binding subunit